jgi:hypothetical protein
MGDDWEQNPRPGAGQPNQDEIDKRIEELRRTVVQGANEAQQRIKRVVDKAGEYWQQTRTSPEPAREAKSVEEQRIRQLANMWSIGNWRLARDLGTYMDIVSWHDDEVWEVTVQTRWESRAIEMATEPYTGRAPGKQQPLLPIWDYELPPVSGLKAPTTRTRLEGLDDLLACTACNSTGRLLCATCTGRGWIVCPDCLGRTKVRCSTCRGRGYIADWTETKKKPFFQKQAENLASSVTDRVADVFDGIRQQGVPIPNPIDNDPATKGRTIPCPDCVNGEVDCTCGTGKRVCSTCQGAKTEFCPHCGGTGKVVRHREMVRSFTLRTDTHFEGSNAIPEQYLLKANGELVYSAEVDETLHEDAAPDSVPMDIWHLAVQRVRDASTSNEKLSSSNPMAGSRATLQVLELVRIPFTKADYRYGNQDYTFYVYDSEGQEKFYAERFPARWDRIERLVRSITTDLMAPADVPGDHAQGYRVPVERPPYTITEENFDDPMEKGW